MVDKTTLKKLNISGFELHNNIKPLYSLMRKHQEKNWKLGKLCHFENSEGYKVLEKNNICIIKNKSKLTNTRSRSETDKCNRSETDKSNRSETETLKIFNFDM